MVGCTPEFTPASVVDDLRILAVRSEPAAAAPGESMVLQPLIVDPKGQGRVLAYAWAACVYPDSETGEMVVLLPADCAVATTGPQFLGVSADITFTVPPEVAKLTEFTDLTSSSGTFAMPLRLIVRSGTDADAEIRTAIVSVAVVLEGDPNTNPMFESFSVNGELVFADEPIVVRIGQSVQLQALWPDEAVERYTVVAAGTSETLEETEVLSVAWFASVGRFDPDYSSDENLNVAYEIEEAPTPNMSPMIWAVLTDGRGGVATLQRRVTFEGR